MSKKVKIIGCVAVLVTGLTGSAQDLNENDVIRHYDVTGKICPKYFVEHEDEWEQFKKDVDVQIAVVEQEVETASQQ